MGKDNMSDIAYTFKVSNNSQYGLLPGGFQFDLQTGYSVLVGRNNSGKSTLLQFIFKLLCEKGEVGRDTFCFIGPDRQYVLAANHPPQSLGKYNGHLFNQCAGRPLTFESLPGQNPNQIYTLFLHRSGLLQQMGSLNAYLGRLGFEIAEMKRVQEFDIGDFNITRHGSGLRSVLSILAALTSPD